MKKLIVLMVLVVAMIAAPLFAEVTVGNWAGDFTYKFGTDFEDGSATDSVATDLDLSMSAMVGEVTTFSVGLGSGGSGTNVTVNTIKMTQDLSALVGDAISLKYTVGNQKLEPTEYETIGMYNHTDTTAENSFLVQAGMSGVTLKLFLVPVSLIEDDNSKIAVEAIYASDMVSANVAFVNNGVEKGVVEGGVKVVAAGATVAAMVNMDLDAEVNGVYAGVKYAMAPITAQAGFYASDVSEVTDTGMAKIGVDFAATDSITVKAGAKIPFAEGSDIGFDGGVVMKWDTVAYTLGVSYMDSDYVAPMNASAFTEDMAVSFKMDVDF